MVIVVVGLPGVGKSFFARRFAETFNAPLVSEDKIRYTLFSGHTYSKNENIMVEQVARLIIDELLVSGKTFILDGGYNTRSSRENITRLATQYGFRTLIVWVQTDELTARRRAEGRSLKNPGDQYKQSLNPEQYDTIERTFTVPDLDLKERNTVVISGKHTYAAQAKTVLQKIVESRSDLERSDVPINREDSVGRSIFPST
jgi:predicted kinase